MDNGSCCPIQGDPVSQVMPPLLILFFVLGALGNGIALCGFCFHMKTWKPSTIYLFNLAVADFLLTICLPLRTDYYRRGRHWAFDDIPCRVALFMLAMNRAGSIVFLTVVAMDRYFKVVHPHHMVNAISNRTAAGIACALWAMVILGTLYLLMESHLCVQEKIISCESFIMESANGWHDIMFQLEFFLPLGIILFCSVRIIWSLRQRQMDRHAKIKRAITFVLVVAVVFVICFLPSVAVRMRIFWLLRTRGTRNCDIYRSVDLAFFITLSFTYMNSMLDPLVYYFSSPSFPKFYTKLKIRSLRPKRPGCPRAQRPEEMPISNLCRRSCASVANSLQSQSEAQWDLQM